MKRFATARPLGSNTAMPETTPVPDHAPVVPLSGLFPIRILVVDDDEGFLDAVRLAIAPEPDLRLRAVARSLAQAREVLDGIEPHGVDVLLVDLGLPDGSGSELIREVTRDRPETDIMVVTVFGDEAHVLQSIEAGATGYLLKRSLRPALAETVRELRAGGSPISPVIARQLLQRFKPPEAEAASPPAASGRVDAVTDAAGAAAAAQLSEREREVLIFIAKGFTVGEIAGMLQLSAHTVATHVKHIYRKLAVHTRTEALFEAGRMGLL